ncbi:HAMP domain-containing protein [Ornithinimicrobium murale]|uniref:HAMP domain-containing protein n=1 Tax=Ornithinimicrobium murale TaxID=1050153 RepID=UPI00192DBEC1|nr:HAMP domain-containing protein [Ornithinimicrobium murale]
MSIWPAGELDARVRPSGPGEVRAIGGALNHLATRIGELLAAERESVADLSHRLRTPLTATVAEESLGNAPLVRPTNASTAKSPASTTTASTGWPQS